MSKLKRADHRTVKWKRVKGEGETTGSVEIGPPLPSHSIPPSIIDSSFKRRLGNLGNKSGESYVCEVQGVSVDQ